MGLNMRSPGDCRILLGEIETLEGFEQRSDEMWTCKSGSRETRDPSGSRAQLGPGQKLWR